MKRIILIFSMLGFLVQAQTKRDPRMVGMAGAYTTIASRNCFPILSLYLALVCEYWLAHGHADFHRFQFRIHGQTE